MKRLVSLILLVVMCLSMSSCSGLFGDITDTGVKNTETPKTESSSTPEFSSDSRLLEINYLDVGQGDSIFIELPDGKSMLIDASISSQGEKIVSYIKNQGYSKIDYVIATHPHADHIGGMTEVLENFDVDVIYMPDVVATTKTFERMIDTIEEKNITVKRAKAGVTVYEDDDFGIKLLAPNSDKYDDMNDYSAVVRIEYNKRAFMFMGDAHELSEEEITADVFCDVVKVGHHGSRTSSCENFVKRTGAEYAIFSLGEGNDYGHPHAEAIERWKNSGAEILRTDLLGDIVVTTDGDIMTVTSNKGYIPDNNTDENKPTDEPVSELETPTELPNEDSRWVLNSNNKKIHTPGCSAAASINEANKKFSNKSIQELEDEGYTACKLCNPTE